MAPIETIVAMFRSIAARFPNAIAYRGFGFGHGLPATMELLHVPDPATMASRLPPAAALDLVEWGPLTTPEAQFGAILGQPVSVDEILAKYPNVPALSDDRPINEYYFLREL